MSNTNELEVWLRGPLPDVPPLLQPVAHALLQAREEVNRLTPDLDETRLWERPAGLASPGFHLQHMKGVLDRLFTYARGEMLTDDQLAYLKSEGQPPEGDEVIKRLVQAFNHQVDIAIQQLIATDINILTQVREVGRAKVPSTVIGLYTHSAEHTMRHLGQLLVTVKVLKR